MNLFFAHHPGLSLLSRVLAAVLGGYLLASAMGSAISAASRWTGSVR